MQKNIIWISITINISYQFFFVPTKNPSSVTQPSDNNVGAQRTVGAADLMVTFMKVKGAGNGLTY